MGGIPVIYIDYELEEDALDVYQPSDNPLGAVKSLLRTEIGKPPSIIRYDDVERQTRRFVCCTVGLSGRTYSSKELDAIAVPPEIFRVPRTVKTRGELGRKFSPSKFVKSYGADGKARALPWGEFGLPS